MRRIWIVSFAMLLLSCFFTEKASAWESTNFEGGTGGVSDSTAVVLVWETSSERYSACGPVQNLTIYKESFWEDIALTHNCENLRFVGYIGDKYRILSCDTPLQPGDLDARECVQ